jgi:AcrR family transcriptional regulator
MEMKSDPLPLRTALAPQREPGKRRVAALLEAAAAVFRERGFEAATMAEIAARAEAPIGSLYRFFPNKDALGEALLQQYAERLDQAFIALDGAGAPPPLDAFADALLNLFNDLRGEKLAIIPLLEAHVDGPRRHQEFHDSLLRQIAGALRRRAPALSPQVADDMAAVLLQNMKAMKMLTQEDAPTSPGALGELRTMTLLYLASKLGEGR